MGKIILTGYDGFIGQNFRERLEKEGKEIVRVERSNSWHFRNTFHDWRNVELIIHQGAISDTTCTNLQAIHNFNVDFSEWLFKEAIDYQIPVKYASSASVYGNQLGIISPLNYYSISKLVMDYWVTDHLDEFSFIQGFRYFNVYGNYEEEKLKRDQSSPISKFIHQAKEDKVIKLFANSDKALRDFVCVDDVVEIVLNNDRDSGIYDLGTSKPVSFQQVADCVCECYTATIEYIPFPDHLTGKYQFYTCAKDEWGDYRFKTVQEYVKDSVD